jgi:hypothetical protein
MKLVNKQKNPWVFEPEYTRKGRIFDGRIESSSGG